MLDRHCLGCHDGRGEALTLTLSQRARGQELEALTLTLSQRARGLGFVPPDLSDRPPAPTMSNQNAYNLASRFTPSYYALRKLVRTPTRESDMHLLMPWEFHADTTRLVQMLQKGHHGVQLDAESWDRLVTWIDLNAPAHGTWTEICGAQRVARQRERRRELRKLYTGQDDDPEAVLAAYQPPPVDRVLMDRADLRIAGQQPGAGDVLPPVAGWPFDAAEARRRQASAEHEYMRQQ